MSIDPQDLSIGSTLSNSRNAVSTTIQYAFNI